MTGVGEVPILGHPEQNLEEGAPGKDGYAACLFCITYCFLKS